jgi:hypothetical protein
MAYSLSVSSLVFPRFSSSWVARTVRTFSEASDCNEGCQNSATGLRAGFCQGDPLGEPSPSATPATLNSTYTSWNRRLPMVIYLEGAGRDRL